MLYNKKILVQQTFLKAEWIDVLFYSIFYYYFCLKIELYRTFLKQQNNLAIKYE